MSRMGSSRNLDGNTLIRGKLAGLELEHRFALSPHGTFLEKRILQRNHTHSLITLSDFEAGS
jgi:hypothetical protein